MGTVTRSVSGWGRFPVQSGTLHRPERFAGLHLEAAPRIARGQGRSYGDAALNEGGELILTERINRLLAFDPEQGLLTAEAGVTLDEIIRVLLPRGWFPAITPGTRHVSLGGCVAADVHGKNHHHDGSFAASVEELVLIGPDGRRRRCSRQRQREAFRATLGGMGLTGVVGEVTLRLRPVESAYIVARHRATADLDETIACFNNPAADDPYTVAWIDGLATGRRLGRGIYMRGRHATVGDLPEARRAAPLMLSRVREFDVPFDLPGAALNPVFLRAFNSLYYSRQGRRAGPFVCDLDAFFYPLDRIRHWNRLYGRRGFLQYQCVVPEGEGRGVLREVLERLAAAGCGSFLAVLKRLGAEGEGLLSFPMPGYTLALDIPYRDGRVLPLLAELDALVAGCGGRVYLAKDARLGGEQFRAMYPRFAEWSRIRRRLDPEGVFSSSLSRRLRLEEGP